MRDNKSVNYALITELPGLKATQEQMTMLYQRYNFARQFVKKKDVLEVACGSGIGLGYIAKVARRIVGIDIDEKNIALCRGTYQNRQNIAIDLMDAHKLSFPDKSFDIILLYEALYYFKRPQEFISETERVLKNGGLLIICTVNKDWKDFHPSPYTYKYFSLQEIHKMLNVKFNEIKMYGGFFVEKKGLRANVISFMKHIAINFNLIPGSLKFRAYLKRIFLGKVMPLPEEVFEDMASYEEPVEVTFDKINKDFKIIYAVAKK